MPGELNAGLLRDNLAALASRNSELAERLCWPAGDDHIEKGPDGSLFYRLGRSRLPLGLSKADIERSLAGTQEAHAVFLFGIGLGEMATALLADQRRAQVVAWERGPWLMRLALGRNDFRSDLASGRLQLLLGTDLLELACRVPRPTIAHPLLGQMYATEQDLLEAGTERPVVLVCEGGLFVRDLVRALSRRGFASYTLDLRQLSREELGRSMRHARPAFVAAINYTGGLAEFCAEHGTKLVCWEIDPRGTTSLSPCSSRTDATFIFTYRRSAVREYRAAGFSNVEFLPLATDPERRQPVELASDEEARYRAKVSIVAASMVPEVASHERTFLEAWGAYRGSDDRASAEGSQVLRKILEGQARDDSRYRIPELFEEIFPEFVQAAGPGPVRAVGEIAAALKRLTCARRLAPFGVKVWGDAGWREVEGAGVGYQGPAGHEREIAKIYCGSEVNVDLGRLYQMEIVTMRVFDVMACGGLVLAERSDDLGSLFEVGAEVDCYGTPHELSEKVAYYLSHPLAAKELAQRGREAVLARHTIGSRVDHMLRVAGCG